MDSDEIQTSGESLERGLRLNSDEQSGQGSTYHAGGKNKRGLREGPFQPYFFRLPTPIRQRGLRRPEEGKEERP